MEKYIYIGRQPILDKYKNIQAYELLYRENVSSNFANIKDATKASIQVLSNTFNNIGLNELIGNKKAFINVNYNMIFHSIFNYLPPEKVVIEILEDTKVDDKLLKQVEKLKQKGFAIALDDFLETSDTKKLIPYADYIKVDIRIVNEEEIKQLYNKFKSEGKILLAEKVETYEEFEFLKSIGFDLYQGYFFAKPAVLTRKSLNPSKLVLIKLLNSINKKDISYKEIEEAVKSNVNLTYSLLKFVNSAYFSFKSRIKSIKHAIYTLGLEGLRSWTLMTLYISENQPMDKNPILDLALIRAKTLELVFEKVDKKLSEEGYLTGMLSLIDVVLEMPIEKLLDELKLDNHIKEALVNREGILGKSLRACEFLEANDIEKLDLILKELPFSKGELLSANEKAILFVEKIKS